MKNKLVFIQPILASYRAALINELSSIYDVTLLSDQPTKNSGFKSITIDAEHLLAPSTPIIGNKLYYQREVLSYLWKKRPQIVVSFANPRYLTFWLTLILGRMMGIRVYSHGQGIYAHSKPSLFRRLIYRSIVKLSFGYISYSPLSTKTLLNIGCRSDKVFTTYNSLSLNVNVKPQNKSNTENGILFIGRIREECNLEALIDAIAKMREIDNYQTLHVIGSGPLLEDYKFRYAFEWIKWHGAIFDDEIIAEISLDCRLGCYPGNAGLSIVHMFGLSIPPLVHGNISEHMGPEPSFIDDQENGFFYDKSNPNDLFKKIQYFWNLPIEQRRKLSCKAFNTYEKLSNPNLGKRFIEILESKSAK